MRKLSGILAAVAMLALASSASAATVTVFFTSTASNATTPAAAAALGTAPTVPRTAWDANNDGIPDATIPVQVWMAINPEGGNFNSVGYTDITGGGFDIGGDNGDVKGTGMNLFRTYNTAATARRWDSASATANGVAGAGSYLWKGTSFDIGVRTGGSTNPGASGPKAPDTAPKYFLLMNGTLTVNGGGMTSPIGTGDGFFDVFFELANNDFGAGPDTNIPVPTVQWGFNGPSFFGQRSVSGTARGGPVLRIVTPEPATMCLLGLGGLFLRRRR